MYVYKEDEKEMKQEKLISMNIFGYSHNTFRL